jgi:SAM-dependent methyltransferase
LKIEHRCLACGANLGEVLFSIPNLPLVDSFCRTEEEAKNVPTFSIDLRQCDTCQTIQVASPPDTSEIYRNYIYDSTSSPDLAAHFYDYSKTIKALAKNSNSKILEIGANDGLLLSKLHEAGLSKLTAIDPSPQTAKICLPELIVVNDFFNPSSASKLDRSSFEIIIANNCFSHIPELTQVLSLCKDLLMDSGTLIVEVQSTLNLLEGVVFDYVYHEHYFYHTATSFDSVATIAGLELYNVSHVSTKGGSYRLFLGHPGVHEKNRSVDYWKYRESVAEVHKSQPWHLMHQYLQNVKASLNAMLEENIPRIGIYGASATCTVLMRYFELDCRVEFIVDDNPRRQGLFAPGTGVPVLAPSELANADLLILAAWRHASLIAPKIETLHKPYIIPLPIPSLHNWNLSAV